MPVHALEGRNHHQFAIVTFLGVRLNNYRRMYQQTKLGILEVKGEVRKSSLALNHLLVLIQMYVGIWNGLMT